MRKLYFLSIFISCLCYGQEGALDTSFNIGGSFTGTIQNIDAQSDNKIIIALTTDAILNGQSVKSVFRLNADGTLDNSFQTGNTFDSFGEKLIAIQDNGKIIIAGSNGSGEAKIIRLNIDGSFDTSFAYPNPYYYSITALKISPDGKILIASNVTGSTIINRYNADGSLDSTFYANVYSAPIYTFAIQADGKIITGGLGQTRRLNPNGSTDNSFTQNINLASTYCITIQNDGKILVAGSGQAYNDSDLVRLNPDGSRDPSLSIIVNTYIKDLYVQQNNRIILSGWFDQLNGISRRNLARIYSDGIIDNSFNPGGSGANNKIIKMIHQSDDKLLIAGDFTSYNGISALHLVRLNPLDVLQTDDFSSPLVSVYPNPTKGIFNIDSVIQPDKMEVYDIMGRFIGNSNDLSNQGAGIYIVKIYTADKVISKKVVKS